MDSPAHGTLLDEVLRHRSPLEPAEALRLAVEVLEALKALHATGAVHGALGPEHLLVRREPQGTESVWLLSSQRVPGSIPYPAPEQLRAEPPSPRTDLYAVGTLLVHTLTGRRPSPAEAAPLGQGLPPSLDVLLCRLLAEAPGQRPDSADAVLEELRELALAWLGELPPLTGLTAFQEVTPPWGSPAVVDGAGEGRGPTRRQGLARVAVGPPGASRPEEQPVREGASGSTLLDKAKIAVCLVLAIGAVRLEWLENFPDAPSVSVSPSPIVPPASGEDAEDKGSPSMPRTGKLQFFSSVPCNADIFVDGKAMGNLAKRGTLLLSSGAHRIELRNNPGIRNSVQTVFIRPGVTSEYEIRYTSP